MFQLIAINKCILTNDMQSRILFKFNFFQSRTSTKSKFWINNKEEGKVICVNEENFSKELSPMIVTEEGFSSKTCFKDEHL